MSNGNLNFYFAEPFSASTQIIAADIYVGDGSTTTFTLVNKTAFQMGRTIEVGGNLYYQDNNAFTVDTVANTFTLPTAPGIGVPIVVPGVASLAMSAFDQAAVDGGVNSNITQVPFFMADVQTINIYAYNNDPLYNGIIIGFVDEVPGYGADLTMVQLACADANGNPMTYLPTGQALFTPELSAFSTILASSAVSASGVYVQTGTASSFYAGDYVFINQGNMTAEIRQIIAVNTTTDYLQFAYGVSNAHYSGETVRACGRKFFAQWTCPIGISGGSPRNLENLTLARHGRIISRV